MSLLEARRNAVSAERRTAARFTVDIPAKWRTVGGDRDCTLANISVGGAKLNLATRPPEGVAGYVIFRAYELYCKVIWSDETHCGVEFERALTERALVAIAGEQARKLGPVAQAGKIQMGRKRSGRLVSSED